MFNMERFCYEKNKEICKEIAKEWEKLDYSLFLNKDKKYKVVHFKIRKLQTKNGLVCFKRRIYRYYNIVKKKWLYISLLDKELVIRKQKRLYNDVYNHIIKFLGDGKRYRDIQDTIPNTNISISTISKIFQNADLKYQNQPKIKVNDNETIYINLDDCFLNFNRKNKATYKFRIISFNTGLDTSYKKKPFLKNKRITAVINQTGLTDDEKYVDFIWSKLKQFYDFNNAKIVVGGDGAIWIRNVAKWFGANYIFDRWHALKLLWMEFRPNQGKRKLKLVRENFISFMEAKKHFLTGNYHKLIEFLETKKVAKATLTIFKNNKEGIVNQTKNWNIGVSAESDVFHFVKSLKGNGSKMYNSKTYINMVNFKMAKFNNQIRI